MKFSNCLPATVSGLAGLLLLGQVACTTPPIEDLGGGWVRLNGAPSADNPYMEVGCVVTEKESPTLTVYAGSDEPNPSISWVVQVGDWSTEDEWHWDLCARIQRWGRRGRLRDRWSSRSSAR